mmetsp:Transcript_3435/g.3865  ORF Transcript_3435/g.3865 Transcript_3435/m.3865 type:complete len:81 (+) Transcript_3435:2359-2601(+)
MWMLTCRQATNKASIRKTPPSKAELQAEADHDDVSLALQYNVYLLLFVCLTSSAPLLLRHCSAATYLPKCITRSRIVTNS